jgi:hypothetical protein
MFTRRGFFAQVAACGVGTAATTPEEAFQALQLTLYDQVPFRLQIAVTHAFKMDRRPEAIDIPRSATNQRIELLATKESYLETHSFPGGNGGGVGHYRDGVFTGYSKLLNQYSRWTFPEEARKPWPEYAGDDSMPILKKGPFAALFFQPKDDLEIVPAGEGWELHFSGDNYRGIPYNFRYIFPDRRARPSVVVMSTRDNGPKNPELGRQSNRFELKWEPLTDPDRQRIAGWQPPKGAKWMRGKDSGIEAEREAARAK